MCRRGWANRFSTDDLVFRVAVKACIALRVPPILEAICAVALADLMMVAGHIPRIWSDE